MKTFLLVPPQAFSTSAPYPVFSNTFSRPTRWQFRFTTEESKLAVSIGSHITLLLLAGYLWLQIVVFFQNKQDPTSAIFVVDWKSLADDPLFFFACEQTTKVGKILAKFIRILEKHGASRSRLHLIGFSLGGKVVSAAGKALTKPKIMRISGRFMKVLSLTFMNLVQPLSLTFSTLAVIHLAAITIISGTTM